MKGFQLFCAGAADWDLGGNGCVAALCGELSLTSHGSLFLASACRVFSTEMPFAPWLAIDTGVSVLDAAGAGCVPSNRTNASTALSTLPLTLLRMSEFRLLSLKPMSLRVASFASKLLLMLLVMLIPNNWLGLLLGFISLGLVGSLSLPLKAGDKGGVKLRSRPLSCFPGRGRDELADRSEKPNFLPGLGGKGGGSSLQLPVPVLPVFCLAAADVALPAVNSLCSYFRRIYLSIAPSTSSASIGISARTLFGLNDLLL